MIYRQAVMQEFLNEFMIEWEEKSDGSKIL